MDPKKLAELGEEAAQRVVDFVEDQGLGARAALEVMTIAYRLLKTTYPGSAAEAFAVVQEADAKFSAVTTTYEPAYLS